jgi:hypothetical protein
VPVAHQMIQITAISVGYLIIDLRFMDAVAGRIFKSDSATFIAKINELQYSPQSG